MDTGTVNDVSGYWFGAPIWFELPQGSDPTQIPQPFTFQVVFERSLKSGGGAKVTHDGLVFVDFRDLDVAPSSSEVIGSPFAGDEDLSIAGSIAARRVEILNAHQLCLMSAIGTLESYDEDTGPDYWSPKSNPVSVRNLWSMSAEGISSVPSDQLADHSRFMTKTSTLLRSMFTQHHEVLDRAFDDFEKVLKVELAPRVAHGLVHAMDHYRHWRFDQALVMAWTATETLLNQAWDDWTESAADEVGFSLNRKRKDLLIGKDFTTSIVTEMLALVGVVDENLYSLLSSARSARNKWAHALQPVSGESASAAIFAGQLLFNRLVGTDISISLGVSEARV